MFDKIRGMTIAPIVCTAGTPDSGSPLRSASAALSECARDIGRQGRVLSRPEALQLIIDIEQTSRIVDHLQVLAARLAEEHYRVDEPDHGSTSGSPSAAGSLLARAEQATRAEAPTPTACSSASSGTSSSGTSSSGIASSSTASSGIASSSTASSGIASSGIGGASGSAQGSRVGAAAGGFRDCADFLRGTLGISRAEARRRLALAELVLHRMSPTGAVLPARLETLGAAAEATLVSGRAATIVSSAAQRVQSFATPEQVESMEDHLTRQAVESDEDILRVVARRWEGVLDQDGQELSAKVLRARQGVFLKGRRHGLHVLEIGATDEQFEHLATVMNTATNPRLHADRTGTAGAVAESSGAAVESVGGLGAAGAAADGDAGSTIDSGASTGAGSGWGAGSGSAGNSDEFGEPGGATRAQMLLEGLVTACRIALSTAGLPATGGHRPQVMVTMDYQELLDQTPHLITDFPEGLARILPGQTQRAAQRPGRTVFAGQASARTIRRIACDADIIPIVLGGAGQVLDLGRARRLFPPHLRRALVARDKGCAFPDCTIPAPWCEAHHIDPWSRGGRTSIGNGVLLCSRHHHLIHQGAWRVEPRGGVPWFHVPGHPGRAGAPRTNTYWRAGRIVHHELLHHDQHHEVLHDESHSRASWLVEPLHDQTRNTPAAPGRNRSERTRSG
ncbi:hypothetical protein MN0502_15840 [Arthrobacter sp. MN05-02]|nr:hypothetical protein MN0502_15840 [Arthrobacter sp. MN05-02]